MTLASIQQLLFTQPHWTESTIHHAEKQLDGDIVDHIHARVRIAATLLYATVLKPSHRKPQVMLVAFMGLLAPAEAVRRSYNLGLVARPRNAVVKALTSKPAVCCVGLAALAGLWYLSNTRQPEPTLVHRPSSAGMYVVQDDQGQTIASFKPENERPFGPEDYKVEQRGPNPTNDDIVFNQLDSFTQGRTAERQALALSLEIGDMARMPRGEIKEITSRAFVNARGSLPRLQTKRGFFQEWVQGATPMADIHSKLNRQEPNCIFAGRTILDQVPLDEYQKIGIQDILLYNQDRHPGNVLVTRDAEGLPHLVPIDHDAILPYKLDGFTSLLTHRRAQERFTTKMQKAIAAIDPEKTYELVRQTSLPEQMATNAKALALTVQTFAKCGRTLADLYRFIATQANQTTSALWDLMTVSRKEAEENLSPEDQAKLKHDYWLRWCLWKKAPETPSDAHEWLSGYRERDAARIESQLKDKFWELFNRGLKAICSAESS